MFISPNAQPETREAEIAELDTLEARRVAVEEGQRGYRVLMVKDPDGNQMFFPYPNEPS